MGRTSQSVWVVHRQWGLQEHPADHGTSARSVCGRRVDVRARWEQLAPEQQAAELAKNPLRRLAQPEDQARVICFLASADADFVNGVTIDVTGGL